MARVISPAKAKIIHPPLLRNGSHRSVDADIGKILEVAVQSDWCQGTVRVRECRASGNRHILDGNEGFNACADINLVAREREVAVRSLRITSDASTINVEEEAAGESMIAIRNLTSVSKFIGVWTVKLLVMCIFKNVKRKIVV